MGVLKKIGKWISDGNDCAKCPASWVEACETECGTEYEGGCCLYGDEWPEPCRLLLPKFLRAFFSRRYQYRKDHEYDDYGDWYAIEEAGRDKIMEVLEKELENKFICWKSEAGVFHELDKDGIAYEIAWRSKSAYDDFMRPPYKRIRGKWAELIKETIAVPVNFLKSYFIK